MCWRRSCAYGGLVGPVSDAARLVALHLNDGELDGVRILPSGCAQSMREVRTIGRPYDVGLGWFRHHDEQPAGPSYVEHLGGGGGFWGAMRLYPDVGCGVVVLGNVTRRFDVGAIADSLVSLVSDGS